MSSLSPFNWRGQPSIFMRPDPQKSRQQQSSERAWESGAQPAHRGKEPSVKKAGRRMDLDVSSMVELRRKGYTWRAIALKFDLAPGTVIDRVCRVAPELSSRVKGAGVAA